MDQKKDTYYNHILLEAEKHILSIAINSPKASYEILNQLKGKDFLTKKHQIIFEAISQLSLENKTLSIENVASNLIASNKLEEIGGIDYLGDISSYFYTDEGFEDYVEEIFMNAKGRCLEKIIMDINILIKNKQPIDEILMYAQHNILNIENNLKKDDLVETKNVIHEVIRNIELLEKEGQIINGVPSGITEIDHITFGWQNGDFIILAARPSMGKTAFALNLAINAAETKKGVVFFSLEMPKEQLIKRMLSTKSCVDMNILRTAKGLNKDIWSQITSAASDLKKTNIIIDDTPGLTILQLQSKLRKIKRDFNIDICFIDYLQLIASNQSSHENRQNEVALISRQLKKIARELNIPIICLSQLSRNVEKREDKTPLMSDLRDSGAIEQDADIIMFLYRKAYYEKNITNNNENNELTEIIISKHRNGSTGVVEVNFQKKWGLFNGKNDNN